MGEIDITAKNYFTNKYVAEEVIKLMFPELNFTPDDIEFIEPSGVVIHDDIKREFHHDIVMRIKMRNCTYGTSYLFGLEPQTYTEYTLPLRSDFYDNLQYHKQISNFKKSHRLRKDLKKEECIGSTSIDDVYETVITIFLWLNIGPYTGPRSKSEFLHWPYFLKNRLGDYLLMILIADELSDETILQLCTDLREVLLLLKHAQNKNELLQIVKEPYFRKVSWEAVLLKLILKIDVTINKEKDGEVIMCKAIEEIRLDGKNEGSVEGIEIGHQEGRQEGRQEEKISIAKKILKLGHSIAEVCLITDLDTKTVEQLRTSL